MQTETCEQLARQLGALFSCSEHAPYVRVRTPFLYPDGDVIDVFVRRRDDVADVTDLGETLRWLRMQTASPKRSEKQRQLIQDVCINHGVETFRGALTVRATSEEDLGDAAVRVAQAALRVADLWFTFRTRSYQSVADEVADFFSERSIQFERAEKFPGRSGRTWTVDFHTRTPKRSSLICVLSTGSRGAARGVAEHVLATWHDLSHMRVPQQLEFVSLFDDTTDVWNQEDFDLLESISEVARWSRPDELEELLYAA